jgi:outer membrane protein
MNNNLFRKIAKSITICSAMTMLLSCYQLQAAEALHQANQSLNGSNIGVANFRICIEKSKLGKKEQITFETMKKQMEDILDQKEKAIKDIAIKFNDPDFVDSLSPEAENELKDKIQALSQELNQQQNQYYQALQQANFKIVEDLTITIKAAADKVAKDLKLKMILSEESFFYYAPELDVSSKVIEKMDQIYDEEEKNAKAGVTKSNSQK